VTFGGGNMFVDTNQNVVQASLQLVAGNGILGIGMI
jgi:hypothetical protein